MVGPRLNAGARKLFDRIGIRPMAPGESSAERFTGQTYPQGVYGQAQTPRGQLSQSSMEKFIGPLSPLSGYGVGTPGMFRGAAPVHGAAPVYEAQSIPNPFGGRLAPGASPLQGSRLDAQQNMPFAPSLGLGGWDQSRVNLPYEMGQDISGRGPVPMGAVEAGAIGFQRGQSMQALGGRAPFRPTGEPSSPITPQQMYGMEQAADQIAALRSQFAARTGLLMDGRQRAFDERWDQYAQNAPQINQSFSVPGLSPGQEYANQVASQVGYGANGADVGLAAQNNANRQFALTNSSMAQRFGPNSPLTAQGNANAALMNRERAGEGVVIQTGGYGSPLTFAPRNQNADPNVVLKSRELQARERGDIVEADRIRDENRAKGDRMRARQAERRAARGGLTERQARELERDQRRQSQDLFQRGISPNSPLGQSMAPALQGQQRQQGSSSYTSPLTREDGSVVTPVPQGAPKSAANSQNASGAAHAIVQQAPIFRAMGIEAGQTPEEMPGVSDIVGSLSGYLGEGRPVGDADIESIHQLAIQMEQAGMTTEDPGFFTPYQSRVRQDLFKQLAKIPAGNKSQLAQWWQSFQSVPAEMPQQPVPWGLVRPGA